MDSTSSSFVNGIVTLQVGHYSNFIGTHWWNIQQSSRTKLDSKEEPSQIQHEILLREGLSSGRERLYTPRLLCVDLKGSLKSLRQDGSFRLPENGDLAEGRRRGSANDRDLDELGIHLDSSEQLSVHRMEPIERTYNTQAASSNYMDAESTISEPFSQSNISSNNFFNLDDAVEVWSDFLGNNYHENTVLLLDDHWHNADSSNFSSFGQGYSSNTNEKFWDSWEDKMHFFVEECDTLQGFQVLTDLDDGFGGLTTRMLHQLQDCYGPKSVAVYGSWPGIPNESIDVNIQLINSALAVGHITQDCSLLAPISLQEEYYGKNKLARKLPYLSYKAESHYQTSAIIASLLDTASLPYRLSQSTLNDFCNNLTRTGHKIVASGLSLPLPIHSKRLDKLLEESCLYENGLLCCLTPSHRNKLFTLYSNQVVMRGIPNQYQAYDIISKRLLPTAFNKDTFEAFVYNKHKAFTTGTTFCQQPLKTFPPYPTYFSSMIDSHGFQQNGGKKVEVKDVPMLTSLFSSNGMFDLLLDMLNLAKKVKKSNLVLMEQTGMEHDEFEENMERLHDFLYSYDERRASELL